MTETVHALNPLEDLRWPDFVSRHPSASVFHTAGWLRALQRTYDYEPVAFTTSPPGADLTNAVLFCEIRSWLTGRRLVSVPFSDHCEPLVDDCGQLETICRHVADQRGARGWRHIELRPRLSAATPQGFAISQRFWFHTLDLRRSSAAVFATLHKDSIQRKIRRAERENLVCDRGTDDSTLRAFFDLVLLTRRRHGLPPQPFAWFTNLVTSFGAGLTVRIARVRSRPIAGMLTLAHGRTLVYKYGASDAAFHPLGGVPFLFWNAIEEACAADCTELDLGRSDSEHAGLLTFKDRLGATRSAAAYWRSPADSVRRSGWRRYLIPGATRMLGHAPNGLCTAAGRLLYRHIG